MPTYRFCGPRASSDDCASSGSTSTEGIDHDKPSPDRDSHLGWPVVLDLLEGRRDGWATLLAMGGIISSSVRRDLFLLWLGMVDDKSGPDCFGRGNRRCADGT